jgi:hypothetical protein
VRRSDQAPTVDPDPPRGFLPLNELDSPVRVRALCEVREAEVAGCVFHCDRSGMDQQTAVECFGEVSAGMIEATPARVIS